MSHPHLESTSGNPPIIGVFPSSVNWYCSAVTDCTSGPAVLYAFGSKNSVFIFQVTDEDRKVLSVPKFLNNIQTGSRVLSLAFEKAVSTARSSTPTLVSGGDDGRVRVWNAVTGHCTAQHKQHRKDVTAVTYSLEVEGKLEGDGARSIVASGDGEGKVVVWNPSSTAILSTYSPITSGDCVLCLGFCPQDRDVLAIGYRSGCLVLVHWDRKEILHRLPGHSQEVQSLMWLPCPRRNHDGSKQDLPGAWPALVASSSRDRSVNVWNAATGLSVIGMTLPKPKRTGETGEGKDRHWFPLTWLKTREESEENVQTGGIKLGLALLVGSYQGQMLKWEWSIDLRNLTCSKPTQKALNSKHNRPIFNIVPVPASPTSEVTTDIEDRKFDGRRTKERRLELTDSEADLIITCSMDRDIHLSYASSGKVVWTLPGLGGFVYSLSFGPSFGHRQLALGVGDKTIQLWSTSYDGALSRSSSTLLWRGFQDKVTHVLWHPTKENCLAFACEDGRVGLVDTLTQKVVRMRSYHRSPTVALRWRPVPILCRRVVGGGVSDALHTSLMAMAEAREQGVGLEEALNAENRSRVSTNGVSEVVVDVHLLYSLDSRGSILQSSSLSPEKLSSDFLELIQADDLPLRAFPTAIDWHSDGYLVAIGFSNGELRIYSDFEEQEGLCKEVVKGYPSQRRNQFRLLEKVADFSQEVKKVLWFPDKSANAGEWTSLLATASTDGTGRIYSMRHCVEGPQEVQEEGEGKVFRPQDLCVAVLKGHSKPITDLAWSLPPGKSDKGNSFFRTEPLLASASLDGSVQVWAISGRPVANFRGHRGRVLAVEWDRDEPAVLYSGGEDQTVLMWDYTEQVFTTPPKPSKSSAKKKKPLNELVEVNKLGSDTLRVAEEVAATPQSLPLAPQDSPDTKSMCMVDAEPDKTAQGVGDVEGAKGSEGLPASLSLSSSEQSLKGQEKVKEKKKNKRRPRLFPSYLESLSSENTAALCESIAQMEKLKIENSSSNGRIDTKQEEGIEALRSIDAVLSDEGSAAYSLVDEIEKHLQAGNWPAAASLWAWAGDLGQALDVLAQHRALTSSWLALAPALGLRRWRELQRIYAEQLKDSGEYQEAGEAADAARSYLEGGFHREALALARMRIPPDHPVVEDILTQWSEALQARGRSDQAAALFLIQSKVELAAAALGSLGQELGLRTAMNVAEMLGSSSCQTWALRYGFSSLEKGDWEGAFTAFKKLKDPEAYILYVNSERALSSLLSSIPESTDSLDLGDRSQSLLPIEDFLVAWDNLPAAQRLWRLYLTGLHNLASRGVTHSSFRQHSTSPATFWSTLLEGDNATGFWEEESVRSLIFSALEEAERQAQRRASDKARRTGVLAAAFVKVLLSAVLGSSITELLDSIEALVTLVREQQEHLGPEKAGTLLELVLPYVYRSGGKREDLPVEAPGLSIENLEQRITTICGVASDIFSSSNETET